ncbi:hypothetical protein BDV98DRAFT_189233 [Pterulicium gracile]|uniref:Uncharacterized protein n=1 Tax=Pterulicium gracile TaxID=1884261 RepID=A0A5C3QCJ4_9AGAR|nr:hypothetical protein BDV98DRAFT_189233 [Pterula gracilis]
MEIETCPITLIPTEVLASILVFSVKDLVDRCSNGNRYNQDYVYPFDPTWSDHVRITMVCSTWRQTALITPEFWSSLPFLQLANLQRFPEMLSRSGATPLRLRVSDSSVIKSCVELIQCSPLRSHPAAGLTSLSSLNHV